MNDSSATRRRRAEVARLAWAEAPRALAELASLIPSAPYLALAPRGDGHPVLVLPGLGASDASTGILRAYLGSRGYAVAGWSLGRNQGSDTPDLPRRLAHRLHQVWQQADGRPVSLVGWSLGGVYARRLALGHPDKIRQVITLGSPIARYAPEPLSGVPATAVYSRSDAVVPWQIARQPACAAAENVEVHGSHVGLGCNAGVLYLVAERLAQPQGSWQPFVADGWKRWLYGTERPPG